MAVGSVRKGFPIHVKPDQVVPQRVVIKQMLFNSTAFVFYFLPAALASFYLFQRFRNPRLPLLALIFWSLVFYGAWEPAGLIILLASIASNFGVGTVLVKGLVPARWRLAVLVTAITTDVLALGYYKYAGFLVANIGSLLGIDMTVPSIVLPLAISFFTFTQIAFLVDAYRGEVKELNLIQYALFVTFFPHLIAGPIYHHKEMMPQFARMARLPFELVNAAAGLTLFAIGLFKKVALADSVAGYADPVFAAAAGDWPVTLLEAWGGALAFLMQIYYDFSGYTDMALGLALMFNVRLPANFNSPYKATSIIDFWRRWHMTLTRFLTDYVYSPIALALARWGLGKGAGPVAFFLLSVVIPVNVTFLVSGVWHGAGWTFVAFGMIHGLALTINYAWREARMPELPAWLCWLLTVLTFMVSLVFFRAETPGAALLVLKGLLGLNGVGLPAVYADGLFGAVGLLRYIGVRFQDSAAAYLQLPGEVLWLAALVLVAVLAPNSQQLLWRFRPTLETGLKDAAPSPMEARLKAHLEWLGRLGQRQIAGGGAYWGAAVAAVICVLVIGQSWVRVQVAQFIYFQF